MMTDDDRSWLSVATADTIAPGQSQVIETADGPVAVFNVDGQFHAVNNLCTHEELPLFGSGADDKDVLMDSGEVVCPHHGARFCPRTGDALGPPAYEPLRTYPVRITEGMVQIAVDE